MRETTQKEATQTHGEYPYVFQLLGMRRGSDFGKI